MCLLKQDDVNEFTDSQNNEVVIVTSKTLTQKQMFVLKEPLLVQQLDIESVVYKCYRINRIKKTYHLIT